MEISLVIFTFYYSLTIRRFIFLIIKKRKVLKRVKKKKKQQPNIDPKLRPNLRFQNVPPALKKKKKQEKYSNIHFFSD